MYDQWMERCVMIEEREKMFRGRALGRGRHFLRTDVGTHAQMTQTTTAQSC